MLFILRVHRLFFRVVKIIDVGSGTVVEVDKDIVEVEHVLNIYSMGRTIRGNETYFCDTLRRNILSDENFMFGVDRYHFYTFKF